jgi:hypothetical protein
MGLYTLENPARAGIDVAKYDGWTLNNIINAFIAQDLNDMHVRLAFRRAILISDEYRRAMRRERINA